jgi:hypothetical protein
MPEVTTERERFKMLTGIEFDELLRFRRIPNSMISATPHEQAGMGESRQRKCADVERAA